MGLGVEDLIASEGIAPKIGQKPALPTGKAGWSKPPVSDSEDLKRVLTLETRPQPDSAKERALVLYMTEKLSKAALVCRCKRLRPGVRNPCLTELLPAQAWALYEMGKGRGVLGGIGVGHGKTLLGLLSPMAMKGCKLALLLVPPNLVTQLITEYELAGEHFRMPSLIVHGKDYSNLIDGAPTLHVLPYSRLSRKEAASFIQKLGPDLIISDECHKLRDPNTATTSRVLRYFLENPHTRFCGWTGSLTDKSLLDYGHLSALALRFGSPLPLDPITLADWARAIDPSDFPAPAGALFKLCSPGEHIESGYHRRLVTTPGVIVTKKSAIDAHLVISERKAPKVPATVKEALRNLRETWTRPDGEEFVEAMEVARSARELACGFYYRWVFPRGETEVEITKWLAARKKWNRELRAKLAAREEHLDSPLLCREAAIRAWHGVESDLPSWKADSWPEWYEVKDTVKPQTEAVRLDPYLAQDAAEWGMKNRGIIWYSYSDFGNWIGELSGLPVHTGGPKAAEIIGAEDGTRSIIASIKAHGVGRDGLQRLFTEQLVVNPPSSATAWEQLLGRLHRVGQESDKVSALVYRHTTEFRQSIDTALKRAIYVQGTLGAEQKLLAGFELD